MTPTGARRRWLAAAVVLALAAAPVAAQDAPGPVLPSVTVTEAVKAEVVGRVPISGTLVPRDEVLVYPQVSGFNIETIEVEVGDRVTAGEVLATLNRRTLAAQLAAADAELLRAGAAVRQAGSQIESAKASQTQADSALERSENLRTSGTLAQATLDQTIAAAETARAAVANAEDGLAVAQAQLQQASAQRDIATLNLEQAEIKAPVAGVVSGRNGKVGAIAASAGDPVFTLIEDGAIEVEAEVIETALGRIAHDDPVDLTIAGVGTAQGNIRLIAPTVDPVNRLARVRIAIDDTPPLRTGLFASGWIITDRRTALTVPATAVLIDAVGAYVLTVADGAVARRAVTVGLIWQDRREIVAGLSPGDTVIARAGAFFRDGDRVNPVDEPANVVTSAVR